jgi:hypothetical protein
MEAVALLLCGRRAGLDRHKLLVNEVHPVPLSACRRSPENITWPTRFLLPLLERAARDDLAIVKIHSHPGGYPRFSAQDDAADSVLFPSIQAWTDSGHPHGSAVLLPDGRIFGRAHHVDGSASPFASVTIVGDEIRIYRDQSGVSPSALAELPGFALRHAQAFGRGTFEALRRLTVVVVGCSGTGSVVIDILARLGVGRLILIDPDKVEEKNLNRILNAFPSDIGRLKVDVQRDFVSKLGFGTRVECYATDLSDNAALVAAAGADVAFGCMDGVVGRHTLNRLATFYLLPYFDVGVRLDADGHGGVTQICGSVHYLQSGLSSLLTRRLYTLERLRTEAMKRHDPVEYSKQVAEKYLKNVTEDRPAVNGVNMFFASQSVLDLLARLHPYRIDGNKGFAAQTISLTGGFWRQINEGPIDEALARFVGRGDMTPFLNTPFFGRRVAAA